MYDSFHYKLNIGKVTTKNKEGETKQFELSASQRYFYYEYQLFLTISLCTYYKYRRIIQFGNDSIVPFW